MKLFEKMENKVRKLSMLDLSVGKTCVIAITLLVAKLWSPILSLQWYWYAIVAILTYVWILKRLFLTK
jgi:hypothetical protein